MKAFIINLYKDGVYNKNIVTPPMSIVDIERYISFLQDNYTEISERDRIIFKHLYHETF